MRGGTVLERPGDRRDLAKRVGAGALALTAVAFLLLHSLAVRTESINWDEFALFARAADSVRTGALVTGGHPGLGVLVLTPLVTRCDGEIRSIHEGRWIWVGWTALAAFALWRLVRRMLARDTAAVRAASLAVGLWFLIPVVQRWSLQVRTDQPAIALALLGSLALLDDRKRLWTGASAGLLFALGYLFTEKFVYVVALGGLLWLGDRLMNAGGRLRTEWMRFALCAIAAALVIAGFRLAVGRLFALPDPLTLERGLEIRSSYSFMRATGLTGGAPTLVPHSLIAALLVWCTWAVRGSRSPEFRRLLLSWSVLALGLGVALFHTSRFVYFWITLGLFPAVAFGLALPTMIAALPARAARITLLAAVALLGVQGLTSAISLLEDSQEVQRASLDFVSRNFTPAQNGFQPERALFCRDGPRPFRTYFSLRIGREFSGPQQAANEEAFLAEFRARPVYYVVGSLRLAEFPLRVRQFWNGHYLPYHAAVSVPGFHLQGTAGELRRVDVIAPGEYRVVPSRPAVGGLVAVDGMPIMPGMPVGLMAGEHNVSFPAPADVVLIWALREPPRDTARPFYGDSMVEEYVHGRVRNGDRRNGEVTPTPTGSEP